MTESHTLSRGSLDKAEYECYTLEDNTHVCITTCIQRMHCMKPTEVAYSP